MPPSAVLLTAAISAQPVTPERRAHHALVYDEASRRVILSGGSTPVDSGRSGKFFNDVWAFEGAAWKPLGTSGEPMSGVALAFDPRAGRILGFGGYNGQSLGRLRTLDGAAWTELGVHPEVIAAEGGAIFDRARGELVTFGGSSGPGQANDATWRWDGARWNRVLGAAPPPRQAFAMAYDERRRVTVAFGGLGSGPIGQRPPILGDTWEFDGTTWNRRQTGEAEPAPRASPGVAYDSKRGRVIVFGGLSASGMLADTWAWDGNTWSKLADTGPSPRAMGYMAYDRARDRVVLFGGRTGWPDGDMDDTWEFDGTAWKSIRTPGGA